MRRNRDKRELAERNQAMLRMRDSGARFKEIAQAFGVSEARAHHIIARERVRLLLLAAVASSAQAL